MRKMTAETAKIRQTILATLVKYEVPMSIGQMVGLTGYTPAQIHNSTVALVRQGHAVRVGRGRYQDAVAHAAGKTGEFEQQQEEEPVEIEAEPDSAQPATGPMADWWMGAAVEEIEATVAKVEEYGGDDLTEIGLEMAGLAGLEEVSEVDAAELAIFFYMRGKMARWASAIRRGQSVSDDTIHDIGVYARMAQWIRQNGGLV